MTRPHPTTGMWTIVRAAGRRFGLAAVWIGLVARAVFALVVLAGLLAGLPYALARFIGWPLPRGIPDWDQLAAAVTSHQVADQVFVNVLACLAWLLWAALLISFPIELAAATRDVPIPHLPALRPAQALTGALIGALTLSMLTGRGAASATAALNTPAARPHTGHTVATAPAAPRPSPTSEQPHATNTPDQPPRARPPEHPDGNGCEPTPAAGPASATTAPAAPSRATTGPGAAGPHRARPQPAPTRAGNDGRARRLTYTVRSGDWLGGIAERFLGRFGRYPDIQQLNTHLIPDTAGPRGPDHIEPGWRLTLPTDARDRGPRPHARGPLTPPPPTPPPKEPPAPPGSPDTGNTPGARRPPTPPPTPPPPTPAAPAPTSSTETPAPSTTPDPVPPAEPAPRGGAGPTTSRPSPTPTSSAAAPDTGTPHTPNPVTTGPPSGRPDTGPPDATDPGAGVDLPGGWVTIALAAALVAAAAMVWLRRRRAYTPGPLRDAATEDTDLRPMPPVVARLRRAVREQAPELLHPPVAPQPTVAQHAEHLRRPVADAQYVDAEYGDGGDDPGGDAPIVSVGPSGMDLAGLGDVLAPGGLGLAGPGAHAAARALLAAALSAGGPADPDARGRLIIPADTLTTLLGADAVAVGPIPRLTVTATTGEALTAVEELLIERRRLLDDYDTPTVDQLRAADPYHPPIPPVLLLTHTPPPPLQTRLATTVHLGAPLQITAILLGDWAHGHTLTVTADGHTHTPNTPAATGGRRLAVLDEPTTAELLGVLREAHTAGPPPTPPHQPTPAAGPPAPTETARPVEPAPPAEPAAHDEPASATPAEARSIGTVTDAPDQVQAGRQDRDAPGVSANPDHPGQTGTTAAGSRSSDSPDVPIGPAPRPGPDRLRVRVLGPPTIFDRDHEPVPGLRQHAVELLVFLAVHRAGADLGDIMEAFWPHATVRRASERLSTETGNLRRGIRRAAGEESIQPVVNTGGRYHLDPDLLDIDAWRLVDALQRAAATDPADRIAALRDAVDAHTGILADGCDYDWIDQPREQHRRYGIRARLHLADLLADTAPRDAADLAVAAAALDPYNEEITRRAMRALARAGDYAAIGDQLRQLRAALDEIDEEPSTETVALAAQLQHDTTNTTSAPPRQPTTADPTPRAGDQPGDTNPSPRGQHANS